MQVTFELSTDGGTIWTPLGPGTRLGGGWEVTGLSLPAKGAIRARARTTGGVFNGSSGLVEQVAAIPGPVIAIELVPRLRFTGLPGCTYAVQRAPAPTGPWTTLASILAPAGGLIEYVDTTAPPGPYFYRNVLP